MHGIETQWQYETLLDLGSLQARPSGELWRIWWRVGLVLLTGWAACVPIWLKRVRQRNDLRDLDPHLLRDLGLTPRQAACETQKWFWQE
jgi:uncharacterized protein YjiS (DUF1127 family)